MEGTLLYLNPYPADFTERVQIGNGANTFNLNNGLWAQCTFSGSLVYSGTNLSIDIAELGQIAGDFTCCASEMNELKYNATDNCNNLGTANQWVEIRDIDLPAFSTTPQSSEQIICDGYPINTPSAYDQCSDAMKLLCKVPRSLRQQNRDCSSRISLVRPNSSLIAIPKKI